MASAIPVRLTCVKTLCFFFFQAEDGIRDTSVTGVQTCALPIYEARSRHNSAYWSGRPYVGLGPAAHSYDGRARRWNVASWPAYADAIAAGRSPAECTEVLTAEQRELERRSLALRTDAGVARSPCPPDRRAAWGW